MTHQKSILGAAMAVAGVRSPLLPVDTPYAGNRV
jgi:hypothetical protein